MLLRFVAENFLSFKEATEINTFTSSKSKALMHHRVQCAHTEVLRLNAIYGANGAGKSNFVKALNFLREWITTASLTKVELKGPYTFKLDNTCENVHSELAVEFFVEKRIFYYHIEFDSERIFREELLRSAKSKDYPIFFREDEDIRWEAEDKKNIFNSQFLDLLRRMLRPDMPLLSFLGKYYPEIDKNIFRVYSWFNINLGIIEPDCFPKYLPHLLDINPIFAKLANKFICATNNGVVSLKVKKEQIYEEHGILNSELKKAIASAKKTPNTPVCLVSSNHKIENLIYNNGEWIKKTLLITHIASTGKKVDFDFIDESDGTKRLIEFLPLINGLTLPIHNVYVVDEIERSIHPVLMKKMLEIISANKKIQGQLIFTTHESNLLDQTLLRPDEIWITQKNVEQATDFYPLSDYKIHHTANIQNGYLDGRYGGIPLVNKLDEMREEAI